MREVPMSDYPNRTDSNSDSPALEEQLSAYLDGELDEQASRQVEQLLASEPEVRETLEKLEGTWELLDELDRPPPDEVFTQSTLEMVAVGAAEDAQKEQAEAPRRRRRRLLVGGAGTLAAAVVGFLAVALAWPNPNGELLRDLPVLASLDQYRQIRQFAFLESLVAQQDRALLRIALARGIGQSAFLESFLAERDQLLPDEVAERSSGRLSVTLAGANETSDQRRRRIQGMSSLQRNELRRRQEQFAALDPAERREIQQLHDRIQEDPRSRELRSVMQQYTAWLDTLQPYERYELRELPPSRRIQRVEQLRHDEERDRRRRMAGPPNMRAWPRGGTPWILFRVLRREDWEGLVGWIDERLAGDARQLARALPEPLDEDLSRELKQAKHDSGRRRLVFARAWLRWLKKNPGKLPQLDEKTLEELRSKLSADTRQRLEKMHMSPDVERRFLVGALARVVLFSASPGPSDPLWETSEEELAAYLKETVKKREGEWLLALPPKEQRRWLWGLYFASKLPKLPDIPRQFWGHAPGRRRPGAGEGPKGSPSKFGPDGSAPGAPPPPPPSRSGRPPRDGPGRLAPPG